MRITWYVNSVSQCNSFGCPLGRKIVFKIVRNRADVTLLWNKRKIWEMFASECQAFWFLGIQAAAGHFVITIWNEKLSQLFCVTKWNGQQVYSCCNFVSFSVWIKKHKWNRLAFIRSIGYGQVNVIRCDTSPSNQSQGISQFAFPVDIFAMKISVQCVLTWCRRSAWRPAFYQELFLVWSFSPILWFPFLYIFHDSISWNCNLFSLLCGMNENGNCN